LKKKRFFELSGSVDPGNASTAIERRESSLPLLVEEIERVELSFEAVVSILLGLLEKMELRFV
jgi:hypothetical protein